MGKKQHGVSMRVFRMITDYLESYPLTVDLTLVVGSQIMKRLLIEGGRNMDQQLAYCCGIPVKVHAGDPYHFWLENAEGKIDVD